MTCTGKYLQSKPWRDQQHLADFRTLQLQHCTVLSSQSEATFKQCTVVAMQSQSHELVEKAVQLAEAGELAAAVPAFEAALQADPDNARAHEMLAQVCVTLKSWPANPVNVQCQLSPIVH
jgi:predicted O-linked N-acetylglucosamine transferase (SPINDLY family)